MAEENEFKPRNYQVALMNVAINHNTIIYLPTGAGKTYIAVLVLKQLSAPLTIPWSDGGKITILLVNTVALVHQHGKYLKRHTPFKIGEYTGELNVDYWDKQVWDRQCSVYRILIMTCQILTNAVERKVLDLNRVNLLIFDECHRGVNDQPMRQLMKNFQYVDEKPKVLGLTATLLNGNCATNAVKDVVQNLEITYHSKVATVDELKDVLGYSTNPHEKIVCYVQGAPSSVEQQAIDFLEDSAATLRKIFLDVDQVPPPPTGNLVHLDPVKGQKELANLLADAVLHIQMLGTYGGLQAIIAHTIQIECMKRWCDDEKFYHVLNAVITSLTYAKIILSKQLSGDTWKDLNEFSSQKVKELFKILKEYKDASEDELCAIIFVQRRFTAKILYHLLKILSESVDEFSFLKPNFIVGFNANPFTDTRESLYYTKVNREIIQGFFSKEYNIIVSSNVLEEGIDVPTCSLVVKFDEPLDYRSYIQSKGRARCKDSFYYMMVESKDSKAYFSRFDKFQTIEEQLNKYLIGQNEVRDGPSRHEIQELYDEDQLPPYYVNGPGSAHINMVSAVSLLSAYCNSFESDAYTSYAPNWFLEKTSRGSSVVIEMPTVCPYIKPIRGAFMSSKKYAKRAAALKACRILHQIGELDNNLRPIKRTELGEELEFLFNHWPTVKERAAGNKKNTRLHKIHVPQCCLGNLRPNESIYLHVIKLSPNFDTSDISTSVTSDLYSNESCYGILSSQPFPTLCSFPLYVKGGEIIVDINMNSSTITLSDTELEEIRGFNYLLYKDVLRLLKGFLVVNNQDTIFVVPVNREHGQIDFEIIREHKDLKDRFREPTREERLSLDVSETTFLHKIVTPWYRKDDTEYLVTKICYDMTSQTSFPGNHENYMSYYKNLYQCTILNPNHPLIKVEAMSSRTNYIKPRGVSSKKNKDHYIIHLVPELVVVQNFPACLWLQGKLLPSVFDKLFQLLRAEELRTTIAKATGIGRKSSKTWNPLLLDCHLIDYETEFKEKDKDIETNETVEVVNMENILSLNFMLNKEVVSNTLQEDYPWARCEEPVDIERNLKVTLMDIQYYVNFIKNPVRGMDRQIRNSVVNQKPAITYDVDFVPVNIKILDNAVNKNGPQLADIYKALATAKSNDIVNLERSETLGDSFLKYIVSLFIILKYPKYDEGKSTTLKGQMVSNKNLFYLAERKNLGSYLKYFNLRATEDWCPPGFCLPDLLRTRSIVTSALLTTTIPRKEQIGGILSKDTIVAIKKEISEYSTNEESCNNSINYYLGDHDVSDKFVADAVEALLGVYLESSGIPSAIKLLEWFGIIPASMNLPLLFTQPPPNPILNLNSTQKNIDFHIPSYGELEKSLGYTFNNRAYLLQALTHSSYTPNRITHCYQRLEYLGDAVLDFLITMYIYETCGNLNPGDLTDLRSAIVNNITFACFSVRCGFHKYLLAINNKLQAYIDKFIKYQENKNFAVNDDVLILLNEDDFHIAEYVDVPKVLGDIFESLAGAVFLDSGMNLGVVWDVFYRIMWKEINEFRNNVPKNAFRMLHETHGAHPVFHKPVETQDGRIMVKLDFMISGSKKRVHGFGDNKTVARRAAAKIALRLLGR